MVERINIHRFYNYKKFDVFIIEKDNKYYWISTYLYSTYRGKGLANLLIKYIACSKLRGVHIFHLFPDMASMKKLSKEMGWCYAGLSNLFKDCIKYNWKTPKYQRQLAFKYKINYRIYNKYPEKCNFQIKKRDFIKVLEYLDE